MSPFLLCRGVVVPWRCRSGCVSCIVLRGGCVAVTLRRGCVSLCFGPLRFVPGGLVPFRVVVPCRAWPLRAVPCSAEHKMVLRQISCCQVKQVWKILIQRSRSEARPYILLLIHFILLFRPSISPLLIEYFMAFLMGEMSRWTLFTKLTTSP